MRKHTVTAGVIPVSGLCAEIRHACAHTHKDTQIITCFRKAEFLRPLHTKRERERERERDGENETEREREGSVTLSLCLQNLFMRTTVEAAYFVYTDTSTRVEKDYTP